MNKTIIAFIHSDGPTLQEPNTWIPPAYSKQVSVKTMHDVKLLYAALKETCDVLILNKIDINILTQFKKEQPGSPSILLSKDLSIELFRYCKLEVDPFPSHIICAASHVNYHDELKVTLNKILSKQIFGLRHYLKPGATVVDNLVESQERSGVVLDELRSFGHVQKFKPRIVRCLLSVAEELLMNAVKSAPRTAQIMEQSPESIHSMVDLKILNAVGDHLLDDKEFYPCRLQYGFDGERAAVSVKDSFGSFKEIIFFNYLKKVLYRDDSDQLIDSKASGAGLGLYKIIFESHYLICNVAPNLSTEVIAIIDLKNPHFSPTKVPKSLHYFTVCERLDL